MAKSPAKYQVYGLDETYPELGDFSFKIVVSPRVFKAGQEFEVVMRDSDRNLMKIDLKKWGRKLNVTFTVDQSVSDGVASVFVVRDGEEMGRLNLWIIKP